MHIEVANYNSLCSSYDNGLDRAHSIKFRPHRRFSAILCFWSEEIDQPNSTRTKTSGKDWLEWLRMDWSTWMLAAGCCCFQPDRFHRWADLFARHCACPRGPPWDVQAIYSSGENTDEGVEVDTLVESTTTQSQAHRRGDNLCSDNPCYTAQCLATPLPTKREVWV